MLRQGRQPGSLSGVYKYISVSWAVSPNKQWTSPTRPESSQLLPLTPFSSPAVWSELAIHTPSQHLLQSLPCGPTWSLETTLSAWATGSLAQLAPQTPPLQSSQLLLEAQSQSTDHLLSYHQQTGWEPKRVKTSRESPLRTVELTTWLFHGGMSSWRP